MLLNFLLIPSHGALGAAISTFASYGVLSLLLLYWAQRYHPLPLQRGKLAYTLAVLAVAVAASLVEVAITPTNAAVKIFILCVIVAGAWRVGFVPAELIGKVRRELAARTA